MSDFHCLASAVVVHQTRHVHAVDLDVLCCYCCRYSLLPPVPTVTTARVEMRGCAEFVLIRRKRRPVCY